MFYLTNMLNISLEMNTNLKKVQSQVTNVIVHGIKTFKTINCVPYAICIYKLNKISGDYNQDIIEKKLSKFFK